MIVVIGLAWGHASGAGPVGPRTASSTAAGAAGPGLTLSDSGDLIKTALIEAAIMTVVITASAIRRRRRRARRAH